MKIQEKQLVHGNFKSGIGFLFSRFLRIWVTNHKQEDVAEKPIK